MDNRSIQIQKDNNGKKKTSGFWKNFGIVCLALVLSALTVLVINLNR